MQGIPWDKFLSSDTIGQSMGMLGDGKFSGGDAVSLVGTLLSPFTGGISGVVGNAIGGLIDGGEQRQKQRGMEAIQQSNMQKEMDFERLFSRSQV